MSRPRTKALVLVIGLSLSACVDEGGIEHYEKLGTGYFGSALGYTETKVAKGQYDLTYHHNYAKQAGEKIRRRANELCRTEGYKGGLISPAFRTEEELVVAFGRARCSNNSKELDANRPAAQEGAAAELAAVEARQNSLDTALGMMGNLGLGAAAGQIAAGQQTELEARRNSLRQQAGLADTGNTAGGAIDMRQCDKAPKCRSALIKSHNYHAALASRLQGPAIHQAASYAWCGAQSMIKAFEVCEREARARGDQSCAKTSAEGIAAYQIYARDARNTANQTYAYQDDGWMATCGNF